MDQEKSVYDILSEIIGVKFKAQLSDSGILFRKIYKMHNIQTAEESYLLVLDETSIRFTNAPTFIEGFILHLQKSLKDLNEQYKELRLREQQDVFIDEHDVFMQDEMIGHHGAKQRKLLERMRKIQAKL